jgi:hypothetical protein
MREQGRCKEKDVGRGSKEGKEDKRECKDRGNLRRERGEIPVVFLNCSNKTCIC